MSKILSIESLTRLRGEIREELNDSLFFSRVRNNQFDFSDLELISSPNYPEIPQEVVRSFYIQYAQEPQNEFLLAKILHENIRIDRALAANNLFWVYINLQYFYKYISERWLKIKDEDQFEDEDAEKKIDRFFLSLESSQNSLIKSPIAGLWWSIELTIDETQDDKYHYSKIFLSDRNLRDKNLGVYQMIRKKNILFALLDFYDENKDAADENGIRIGSEAIAQQMSKALNQIGGLTLLSFLTKEEILEKLNSFKNLIHERAIIVKKGKVSSREKNANETNLENEDLDESENDKEPTYYVNLNSDTGEYRIMDVADNEWEYNIEINFEKDDCYIITVYEEGKIKKNNLSLIEDKVRRGRLNRETPFKNGVNSNLTVHTIESIHEPVIFGIAYYDGDYTYVKLMDAQNDEFFRTDNGNLNQEGKKVIYSDYIHWIKYKALPADHEGLLDRLIKGPSARGVRINNNNFDSEWRILAGIWPELFDNLTQHHV